MPTVFHTQVLELAVNVNDASNQKFKGERNDIVHDALFILSHDALCVHRAVGTLVDAGWSSPASILLRTLLDFTVSALAIRHSSEPTIAAFTFLYSGSRKVARDQSLSREVRTHARSEANSRVEHLPEALRPRARDVLKDPDRAYWFSREWRNPKDVLEKTAPPETLALYSTLSGPAHGSYLGMRICRENPDAHSIDPELPVGRKGMSVDLASCRLALTVLGIRASMLGLSHVDAITRLGNEISAASARMPPAA